MGKLFKLSISKDDQKEIFTNIETGESFDYPILGLTSKLLHLCFKSQFLPVKPEKNFSVVFLEKIIQDFNLEISGKQQNIDIIRWDKESGSNIFGQEAEDIDSKDISSENKTKLKNEERKLFLGQELYNLLAAAALWFDPNYAKSTKNIIENINWNKLTGYLYGRCRQVTSYPYYYKDEFIRIYESNSLLALCWGEIWWGLENKILCSVCNHCGKIYFYPSNNFRKATCGDKECRQKALIMTHGGIDGYREWERLRQKKKKPGGKIGRPKK